MSFQVVTQCAPKCEISTSPCSFGLWYKSPIHICSFHPVLCLYIFHIFTSTGLCYTAEFRQWWCKEIETFCFRVFFAIGIVFSQLVAQFVVSNIYPQPGCRQWHSFFVPSWSSCFCLRAAAAHTSMLFLKRGRQWPEIFLCSKDLGFLILLNSMVCGCCGGAAGTQAARWLQRERIQRDLPNHVSCFCFSWKTWAWNFDGLDSRRRILPQSVVWYARKYIAPFDFFFTRWQGPCISQANSHPFAAKVSFRFSQDNLIWNKFSCGAGRPVRNSKSISENQQKKSRFSCRNPWRFGCQYCCATWSRKVHGGPLFWMELIFGRPEHKSLCI